MSDPSGPTITPTPKLTIPSSTPQGTNQRGPEPGHEGLGMGITNSDISVRGPIRGGALGLEDVTSPAPSPMERGATSSHRLSGHRM
eukprot:140516-Karenia_brevis.AAC.1